MWLTAESGRMPSEMYYRLNAWKIKRLDPPNIFYWIIRQAALWVVFYILFYVQAPSFAQSIRSPKSFFFLQVYDVRWCSACIADAHLLYLQCLSVLCLFHCPPPSLSLCVSAQCGPYKKMQRTSYHIGCSSWVSCSKYTRCAGPGPGSSSLSRAHAPFVVRPTVTASLASQLASVQDPPPWNITVSLYTYHLYLCITFCFSADRAQSSFQNKSLLFLSRGVHPVFSIRKWSIPTVHRRHVSSGGFKLTFLMLSPCWNC